DAPPPPAAAPARYGPARRSGWASPQPAPPTSARDVTSAREGATRFTSSEHLGEGDVVPVRALRLVLALGLLLAHLELGAALGAAYLEVRTLRLGRRHGEKRSTSRDTVALR